MKILALILVLVSTQAMASIVLNVRCENPNYSSSHLNMQFQMSQNPSLDYFYKGSLKSKKNVVSGVEQSRSQFKAVIMSEYSRALISMIRIELNLKKCNNVASAGTAFVSDYSYTLVNHIESPFICKCVYAL